MTALTFEITFHSPFRVSTGTARAGVDATADMTDPLPATSLKGLMRASAATLLGPNTALVNEIFGSPATPSRWRWSNARPDPGGWHPAQPAARVRIDPTTHTAAPGMLATTEQTGACHAEFTVSPARTITTGTLTADAVERDRLVLAVAGQAIRSLGANRRRGLGWVTVRCQDFPIDQSVTRRFLELHRDH